MTYFAEAILVPIYTIIIGLFVLPIIALLGLWVGFRIKYKHKKPSKTFLIVMGGIVLISVIVATVDFLNYRADERERYCQQQFVRIDSDGQPINDPQCQ